MTASHDNTARVWNAQSGKLLSTLQHVTAVNSARFSPDDSRILSASNFELNHSEWVWDAQSGNLLVTLQGHEDSRQNCGNGQMS